MKKLLNKKVIAALLALLFVISEAFGFGISGDVQKLITDYTVEKVAVEEVPVITPNPNAI